LELEIVLAIFKFAFWFPTKVETYAIFTLLVILAIFLYFFLSFVISATAFWAEEIWATRCFLG